MESVAETEEPDAQTIGLPVLDPHWSEGIERLSASLQQRTNGMRSEVPPPRIQRMPQVLEKQPASVKGTVTVRDPGELSVTRHRWNASPGAF